MSEYKIKEPLTELAKKSGNTFWVFKLSKIFPAWEFDAEFSSRKRAQDYINKQTTKSE